MGFSFITIYILKVFYQMHQSVLWFSYQMMKREMSEAWMTMVMNVAQFSGSPLENVLIVSHLRDH